MESDDFDRIESYDSSDRMKSNDFDWMESDYSNWMGNLAADLSNKPLIMLKMPGNLR